MITDEMPPKVSLHPVLKRLFARRAKLRLSQEAFAEQLGVSIRTYRNWEQLVATPPDSTLAFIKLWLDAIKA